MQVSGSPACDDLGTPVPVPAEVTRVVSLVPSLTESLAATAPGLLVGATDWCTQPPDLAVRRVRGTKNPDLDAILDLRPDVVLTNEEENRLPDLDALRAAGLAIWVTAPRSVPEALASLDRMLTVACRLGRPAWLDEAVAAWAGAAEPGATGPVATGPAATGPALGPVPPPHRRAVVPIWRRPWMALGRDTFAGDVLARLGVANVLADATERYPRVDLAALPPHDLVVLPDEPYAFSPADGPEAFPGVAVACVSGRHLTWYGPSLVSAPWVLARQLSTDVRAG
ncbi:MAG: helical backbone metal receptor [Frankiaceae bacterium]